MAIYTEAVKLLRERRQAIATEMGKIDVAIKALDGIGLNGPAMRRKPKFSAAARARIAAAQRARWKKIKAAQKKS